MQLLYLFGQFAALAAVVVVAGVFLTRYADVLGERTGLGRSIAGLVLLAAGTSLPELSVGASAAHMGARDLAVGGLFGSCLFNLLILAALDLTFRTRGRMLSRADAAHALSATASVVLMATALLFLILQLRWSVLGVGIGTMAIAATYFLSLRLVYYDQQYAALLVETPPADANADNSHITLVGALVRYLAATAVIFFVAPFLAGTADELADVTGLGETFVGSTLVAIATSLPEIVTCVAAVRMGAVEMAIGNIFGSNSFNMVILFGVDFFDPGPLLGTVPDYRTHAVTVTAAILITCIAILGMLYRAERRYFLIEPDAALIVVLVIAALAAIYFLGGSDAAALESAVQLIPANGYG